MTAATQHNKGGSVALALDNRGMLPAARHKATAAEVYDLFVTQAPYAPRRKVIWDAFEAWVPLIRPLLPTARLWIDGGFVTHKGWAAPKDVDVCILVHPSEYALADSAALAPLLTEKRSGVPRVQPMNGLVDSHIGHQGADAYFWADTWSTVLDAQRNVVDGERKGFVEVTDR